MEYPHSPGLAVALGCRQSDNLGHNSTLAVALVPAGVATLAVTQ
jgi:hypothetical protein